MNSKLLTLAVVTTLSQIQRQQPKLKTQQHQKSLKLTIQNIWFIHLLNQSFQFHFQKIQ